MLAAHLTTLLSPSTAPSLDLNFADGPFDGRIAFSRASGATAFDATGTLQTAATNAPRFDYGPIPGGVTNWLFPSVNSAGNPWGLDTTGTVTQNATTAPDGTNTACQMTADATNGPHGFTVGNITAESNSYYTASVYAKAGTSSIVEVHLRQAVDWTGGNTIGRYDLNAVTATCITGGGTASIIAVGNGWYRCSITGLSVAYPPYGFPVRWYVDNASGTNLYAGAGESAYFWGAQCVESSSPETYIPTAYGTPANVGAIPLGLLIEEQRTNSIRNSTMVGAVAGTPGTLPTNWNYLYTFGGITSQIIGAGYESGIPYIDIRLFGTATATSFPAIAMEGGTAIAAANGQTWTVSMFTRLVGGSASGITGFFPGFQYNTSAGVQISYSQTGTTPTPAPLASQRTVVTATAGSSTVAAVQPYIDITYNNGDVIDCTIRIGAPQLELGAFATSAILTSGSAGTRAGDVTTMPVGAWYNAAIGSMSADFQIPNVVANKSYAVVAIDDGSSNRSNIIDIFLGGAGGGGDTQFVIRSGNATIGAGVDRWFLTSPSVHKIGMTWGGTTLVGDADGVTSPQIVSLTGAIPSGLTRLNIGVDYAGVTPLCGYIRRVRYWPRVLSSGELQQVTT